VSGSIAHTFQTLTLHEGDDLNSVPLLIQSYNEIFSLVLTLYFDFMFWYMFCNVCLYLFMYVFIYFIYLFYLFYLFIYFIYLFIYL
jgi:hypothetical protein